MTCMYFTIWETLFLDSGNGFRACCTLGSPGRLFKNSDTQALPKTESESLDLGYSCLRIQDRQKPQITNIIWNQNEVSLG